MSNMNMQLAPKVEMHNIPIPMPEKYEFRVAEYVKDGVIVKVGMQYRVNYYSNNGYQVSSTDWEDVDRVRIEVE